MLAVPVEPHFGGSLALMMSLEGFERTICSEVEHGRSFFLSPDEFEFSDVELYFRPANHLIKIETIDRHQQRQAVGLGSIYKHNWRRSPSLHPACFAQQRWGCPGCIWAYSAIVTCAQRS